MTGQGLHGVQAAPIRYAKSPRGARLPRAVSARKYGTGTVRYRRCPLPLQLALVQDRRSAIALSGDRSRWLGFGGVWLRKRAGPERGGPDQHLHRAAWLPAG